MNSNDEMHFREFGEFVSECCAVNCPATTVENSVKWLLEILPKIPLSTRDLSLVSLLAFMMTQTSEDEHVAVVQWNERQFFSLMPYHVDQMTQSKIWGETAVEKVGGSLFSSILLSLSYLKSPVFILAFRMVNFVN